MMNRTDSNSDSNKRKHIVFDADTETSEEINRDNVTNSGSTAEVALKLEQKSKKDKRKKPKNLEE
jgi:hypothetical protein